MKSMRKLKRILSTTMLAVAVLLSVSGIYAVQADAKETAIVKEGTCGPSLTWTLDDEGCMVVSGEGDFTKRPWKTLKAKEIVVKIKNITTTKEMFSHCYETERIDVSGLDTSKVTDMSGMFTECELLEELDVSGFNTSKVTDMSGMFSGCRSLEELDVSGFNTKKVTDMSYMFYECALKDIDVSKFDTGIVTDMSWMFYGCKGLPALDVSGFDTSNVTDISYMFSYCWGLKDIDVSKFDTGKVTNMSRLFAHCIAVKELDLSALDTSNVTDLSGMFAGCDALTKVDISKFDTRKVTDMSWMFHLCKSLTDLDVSNFDTSNVTDMKLMFCNCKSLSQLDLSNFDTSKVTDMTSIFYGNEKLTKIIAPENKSKTSMPLDAKWVYQPTGEIVTCITKAGIYEREYVAPPEDNEPKPLKSGTKFRDKKSGAWYMVSILSDGGPQVLYYKPVSKTKKRITVPATVTYKKITYKVTEITQFAFKGNKQLKTLNLGKNIRYIDRKAFFGCEKLKTIKFLGTQLKTVSRGAFKGINEKCVIKVPKKKYKAYKKLLKNKGQAKTVEIVKY